MAKQVETQLETEQGIVRVPTGTWNVDPAHSAVEFQVKHMMIATVRGRFTEFEATIEAAPEIDDSRVYGAVEAASIDTNQPDRDAHLRSPDFFDAERHPQIRFESRRIVALGGALGGLAAGIVAPVMFKVPLEGLLVLAAAVVLATPSGWLRVLAAPAVVANLLRPLLLALAARLESPPERLIAGGLLPTEADDVAGVLAAAGMSEERRRDEGAWAALLLRGPSGADIRPLRKD